MRLFIYIVSLLAMINKSIALAEEVDFYIKDSTYIGIVRRDNLNIRKLKDIRYAKTDKEVFMYMKDRSWLLKEGKKYLVFFYESGMKEISYNRGRSLATDLLHYEIINKDGKDYVMIDKLILLSEIELKIKKKKRTNT